MISYPVILDQCLWQVLVGALESESAAFPVLKHSFKKTSNSRFSHFTHHSKVKMRLIVQIKKSPSPELLTRFKRSVLISGSACV